jgi:general secretion pathway protein H
MVVLVIGAVAYAVILGVPFRGPSTSDLKAAARTLASGLRELELKLFTAQTEAVSERKGAIRFYPDGSSTGGRITVASGERKYLVDVDWLTGRVSIGD